MYKILNVLIKITNIEKCAIVVPTSILEIILLLFNKIKILQLVIGISG